MPAYMIQASYSSGATASMIKNPQDRSAVVSKMIKAAGGKLSGFWLSFGDYDLVAIAEMPDNITAAALAMAIGSSGAMSAYKTTPLMTPAESMEAMKKASEVGYKPPK